MYLPLNTDVSNLPLTFTLTFFSRQYRIFVTIDDFSCFKYNKKEHKAENCLNKILFIDDKEVHDTFEAGIEAQKKIATKAKRSNPPLTQYT